jgi:hypothetical protein
MRPSSATYRRVLALAGCVAALGAAGCGSDGEQDQGAPIPSAQAQALQTRLGEIQRRFDFGDGACADILDDSKPGVEQILAAIPKSVSAEVRSTLSDGFQRLFDLTQEQCDEQKGQQTETTTTPTETATVTVTTETETVPTTPTETATTTTETTPPPTAPGQGNNGNGQGNANGNGRGNGNAQGGGVAPGNGE